MMAIVFDLDGTLIDSAGDIHAALNQMLALTGNVQLDLKTVTRFIGKGSENLVRSVVDICDLPSDTNSQKKYLTDFLNIYTTTSFNLTTVFEGVYDALEMFQRDGIQLGLCTNKPERSTKVVLEHFGLTSYFDSIVSGDRLPSHKPNPAMLSLVMSELSVESCLFVGDSEVDVATAKAANVPMALFTKGYRQASVEDLAPEFHFDSYAMLSNIVVQFFETNR